MRLPGVQSDTRTRILHAAIERFGNEGFGANLRAIGADAGVSATAVIKHFGSKDTLHDECDAHVITIIGHYKTDALRSSDLRGTVLTQMATLEEFQPLVRYLMRSFLEGGEAARRLLADMRIQALSWIRDGVEAGHLKPSRNEELRVKYTFSVSIGWMVQSVLDSGKSLGELDAEFWDKTLREMLLPTLEIYTEGLLTDGTLLDEYMLYMSDPPASAAPGGQGDETA